MASLGRAITKHSQSTTTDDLAHSALLTNPLHTTHCWPMQPTLTATTTINHGTLSRRVSQRGTRPSAMA